MISLDSGEVFLKSKDCEEVLRQFGLFFASEIYFEVVHHYLQYVWISLDCGGNPIY